MPDGTDLSQRVCDVPLSHIPFVWARVEGYVRSALEREGIFRLNVEDAFNLLMEGKAKLWVSYNAAVADFDAAMITQIVDYPQCRECRVWLVGGRDVRSWFKEWLQMVEDYARAHGCVRLSSCGRSGWARLANAQVNGFEMVKAL